MYMTIQKYQRDQEGDLNITEETVEQIAHVERDTETGWVTIYCTERDGTLWSLIIDPAGFQKIVRPVDYTL